MCADFQTNVDVEVELEEEKTRLMAHIHELNTINRDCVEAHEKALVAMDPRDAYRALSDPSDPVHENMPLLRPDSRTSLGAPVVEATVGHPTPKEMRAGFCSACCGACG